ncbi:MAG: hypothetical protein U0470_05510 [Anaerolineae bacterium]
MLILDKPRTMVGREIHVPLYHRGHLSFFPQTKVWMCLLPGELAERPVPELIVSPIDFQSWPDLWRIVVVVKDRIGVVHEILQTIRYHQINIVSAESSMVDQQRLHLLEIVADCVNYSSPFGDGNHSERVAAVDSALPALRRAILSVVANDIAFYPTGEPRIRFRRVWNLYRAHKAFQELHTSHHRVLGSEILGPEIESTTVLRRKLVGVAGSEVASQNERESSGVVLTLPPAIRARLQQLMPQTNLDTDCHYLPVSDTTDRLLQVFFLSAEFPIVSPTITHREEPGALAVVTGALRDAGFNIMCSLSRVRQYGGIGESEFVLMLPRLLGLPFNTGELRTQLETALSTRSLERYEISVSYPENYTRPFVPKRIIGSGAPELDTSTEASKYHQAQTLSRLQELALEYAVRVDTPGQGGADRSEDRKRFDMVRALLTDEARARNIYAIYPRVFVSHALSDERYRVIAEIATALGLRPIHGLDLAIDGPMREKLVELMDSCDVFLGLWTEKGARRLTQGSPGDEGDRYWPSPWLHWEMGVAHALGLEVRLLISSNVESTSWKKIVGESHQIRFNESNFREKAESLLRQALQLQRTRRRVTSV